MVASMSGMDQQFKIPLILTLKKADDIVLNLCYFSLISDEIIHTYLVMP